MRVPFIDPFLNKITMYRLILYYLIGLVAAAIALSFLNLMPYSPWDILIDSLVAVAGCYIFNFIFSKFFRAPTNIESVFITALILVLIIPVKFPANVTFFMLASFLAMASKYLVTIDKIHIFNPAAASVAAIALLSAEHSATWWIGTANMLPFVLAGGLLLLRKIEREDMVFTFLLTYLGLVGVSSSFHNPNISSVISSFQAAIFRSPLFFFSFIMLTEPITSPSTGTNRSIYASIVAFLYSTPQLRLFGFAFTPELSLCIGNVFSYIVNPKYKFFLNLKEKIKISRDTYLFNFGRVSNFNFVPGQYMEWTLPHGGTDNRGNRRYFSIASAPSEELMIAVKFYDPSSSYKKALINLDNRKKVIASSLLGDFVLPKNKDIPLAFIAGGVGIAPFRSIIQDIADKKKHVNIILLFANRTKEDIVFEDLLEGARGFGVNTIYTLTDTASIPLVWNGEKGRINPEMIEKIIPDYASRIFYISGPQPMVKSYQTVLRSLEIKEENIIVDYFPGYEEE